MAGTRWAAMAALVDPVRRALYEYVRRQDHPVTREEAADAVAISRTLAAFHLDKLVDAQLLATRYEAPGTRQRGRGRTPKVYEAAGDGLLLAVPPRQYELVGEILADAIAADPTDARASARRHATALGQRLGTAAHTPRRGSSVQVELTAARALLEDLGFEPGVGTPSEIVLDNCPFRALAIRQPELICGISHTFVAGLVDGLGVTRLRADLYPRPGGCCVRLAPAASVPRH